VSCVDTTSGSHHFEIRNYSLTKGCGVGMKIVSSTFSVGEHDWRISCYLDGSMEQDSDCISVFLIYCHKTSNKTARANFSFSLLQHTTGAPAHTSEGKSKQFSSSSSGWGWGKYIKRDILEASPYLKNDSLTIICNVTIIGKPQTHIANVPLIAKTSILGKPLSTLMSVKKGADIIFEVGGQSYPAHRTVVAAGSPVLRAEVSGMMKEAKDQKIKINDIKASVFEALLLYIYTDELPEIEMLTATGMAQHLLVAADRFGMDKLRMSCERKLSESLDVSNVCTALALADQHYLINLKRACLEYLSSPNVLVPAMATEGYTHLVQSCPSIVKEISCKVNNT
jgi:speckle-type POZ protein